jgi:hypothetical protein
LGLTPAHDDSGPEEDEDEEATLAKIITSDLQFSHRGQTLTLRTAVEIKAWLAERRKRWPTAAKREKAKLEAEERNKKVKLEAEERKKTREEEKAKEMERRAEVRKRLADKERVQWVEKKAKERQRYEEAREKKACIRVGNQKARHEKNREEGKAGTTADGHEDGKLEMQAHPQSRADELRQKARQARQAQLDLEAAERELRELDARATSTDAPLAASTLDDVSDSDVSMSSQLSDSSVLTSSDSDSPSDTDSETSSASNSDEDDAPEADSTKHPVLALHQQTTPSSEPVSNSKKRSKSKAPKGPCQYFSLHGRCKYGSKCKFSHVVPHNHGQTKSSRPSKNGQEARGTAKRKGLYQVMVEKEQEEDRKKVLSAIIGLGKRGVFDEVRGS